MPDNQYLREVAFEGGMFNSYADELIPEGTAYAIYNMIPDPAGAGNLVKRAGFDIYRTGVANKSVTSIYVGPTNGVGYYSAYDTTGATAKDFLIYGLTTGAELYSHTDADTSANWLTMGGYDLFYGAVHKLKTTDGVTWSTWSGVPAGLTTLKTYNEMVFGVPASSSVGYFPLQWCSVGDPTTWPASNSQNLTVGSSIDHPKALCWHNSELYIFTWSQFFKIQAYSATDVTVTFSRRGCGCIYKNAVVSTEFGLVWWDPMRGIVISRDGYNPDPVMLRKLRSTFNTVGAASGVASTHCVYRRDLGCVRFYLPLASPLRIDYYPDGDRFYTSSTLSSAGATTFTDPTTAATMNEYVASGVEIYKENSAHARDSESGTPAVYASYIEGRRNCEASIAAQKHEESVYLSTNMVSSANLTLDAYVDNATTASKTVTVTPATGLDDKRVGLNLRHSKLKLKVSDGSGLNQRWKFLRATEYGTIDGVK